jgi:MFS transporter, ACS family, hexuronate transporter
MFAVCGLAYLVAWVIMHLLVPKMKPVNLRSPE